MMTSAHPCAHRPPHYATNVLPVHVVFVYKNFMAKECGGHSHIGLGVNGAHSTRVLRRLGVRCDCYGVTGARHLHETLEAMAQRNECPTHVVVEAPWLTVAELSELMTTYARIHFIVRTHSQVSFLQADRNAMFLLREYGSLQEASFNFTLAANSKRFATSMELAFRTRCLYLPNLYDMERAHRKGPLSHHAHRMLRVGSFGARRVLKNHATAAMAALIAARERGCDLEFYISSNRDDNSGIYATLRGIFHRQPDAKLVEVPWCPWQEFRHHVAHMDVCIQVSATETFNIVTADGCAEGVPSAVGSCIEWAPEAWKVDIDDPLAIARKVNQLLSDKDAAVDGQTALRTYVDKAQNLWLQYLASNPT